MSTHVPWWAMGTPEAGDVVWYGPQGYDDILAVQPPAAYVRPAWADEVREYVAMVACFCAGYGTGCRGYGATAADAERQAADAWNTRQGSAT